jgi:hypothetical protein
MSTFLYFPTPTFSTKMEKIEKHDPPGHSRILGVIDRLLQNPADADGWMHGTHHGRLKKYVGRSDYRLIYHWYWCELCRKEGERLEEQCGFCHEVENNSVIFFDVYHKNEASRISIKR